MEAELVRELPDGADWQFEPKWDGFRGLLENASGELRLWSRNARPLLRYFPELRELGALLPPRSALDGGGERRGLESAAQVGDVGSGLGAGPGGHHATPRARS